MLPLANNVFGGSSRAIPLNVSFGGWKSYRTFILLVRGHKRIYGVEKII